MNDEEIAKLEEELTEARAELDALQTAVADREAKALHLESQLAATKEALEAAHLDIQARDDELGTLRTQTEELGGTIRASAERYRALALERSPELPAELVVGETIADIDAAIERARETVSKVRGHLEAHARSARVPAGAPVRSEPDVTSLDAQQKIALGIEQRRSA